MIAKDLCEKVVLVGPRYLHPKGGIAQILHNYDKYVFENMNAVVSNGSGFIKNILFLVKSCIKLFWLLLTDKKISIVHIHTASRRSFTRSVIYYYIARIMGRKIIMHVHSGSFRDYYNDGNKAFVGRILRSCDVVIALTEKWKSIFEKDLKLTNVRFIHNVIPQPVLNKQQCDDKVHFLFMGLITKAKGIYDIVNAMTLLSNDIKQRIVLHIGGRGEVDYLQNLINDRNLSDIIKFEGWIDGAKREQLLNQCQVLVQPSYVEALSLSILEGMSYQMTILATNIGGIPSIVKDGVNGYMVSPGDVAALAKAVTNIVGDDKKRREMGLASAEIVKNFYPDNVAHELTDLYNSLIGR